MSDSLSREVYEVLEDEYASMYGPLERISPLYRPDQILDVPWVLAILRACDLEPGAEKADPRDLGEARRFLAEILNGIFEGELPRSVTIDRLAKSPALTARGRLLIGKYGELISVIGKKEEELRDFHRRILDDVFGSAVKPLRELRLAHVYARLHQRAHGDDGKVRTALCLSGGGGRSTAFAVGVMQGLASARVLDKFDYLSTVSGGGYAGGWLSSWTRRHPNGISGVQEDLAASDLLAGATIEAGSDTVAQRFIVASVEPVPVRSLRESASRLGRGAGSADAWSVSARYVRNLLLNLAVLVPLITALLALPRVYAFLTTSTFMTATVAYAAGTVICLIVAGVYIGIKRPVGVQPTRAGPMHPDFQLLAFCITPLLGAAILLTLLQIDLADDRWLAPRTMAGLAVVAVLAITSLPFALYQRRLRKAYEYAPPVDFRTDSEMSGYIRRKTVREAVAAMLALVICLALLRLSVDVSRNVLGDNLSPQRVALYIWLAVPAVLLVFFVQIAVFAAVSSRRNEDYDRGWWDRLGAWLLNVMTSWLLVSGFALYSPLLFYFAPVWLASLGGLTGVIGAIAGFSVKTPWSSLVTTQGQRRTASISAAVRLAVPVFVIALMATSAAGTTWLITRVTLQPFGRVLSGKSVFGDVPQSKEKTEEEEKRRRIESALLRLSAHIESVRATTAVQVAVIFSLGLLGWLLSRLAAANEVSLHAFLRNRIIRAVLAPARYDRTPDPLTDFDPRDDLSMHQLRPELLWSADIIDPSRFFRILADGRRSTDTSLTGYGLSRRRLAQTLWGNLHESTRRQLSEGRVTSTAVDMVVRNLNQIILGGLNLSEGIEVGDTFWALRYGDAALRNRAVLDHFFSDVIRPMPRPADAPSGDETEVIDGETERPATGGRRRAPLHVVNMAVNLAQSNDRKRFAFAVTPYHAGSAALGYRDSRFYGGASGMSLGTAISISGVPQGPDFGYHSSPALSFLLALFGARLGWWLGNPGPAGQHSYRNAHPPSLLGPLCSELMGLTDETHEWINLSDGGHFENLGLYEMVLRRCHYIVVSDATADPKFTLADLGTAIQKIRTDLGVPIDIDTMMMFPRGADGTCPEGSYAATASIRYTAVDGPDAQDGRLLYLKPACYSDPDLPPDVSSYAQAVPDFPHESSSDLTASQFEVYRSLGRHVINRICRNYPDPAHAARPRRPVVKQFRNIAQFVQFVDEGTRVARPADPADRIAAAIYSLRRDRRL